MALSVEQLVRYDEQGFVVLEDFYDALELKAMDDEFTRLLEERSAGRREFGQAGKGWILQLGLQSEATERLCADPRILNVVESIVKPGIAIYSAKLVPKEPFDPTECIWHQDDAYYSKVSGSKTRMSIWMGLHDSTIENGCLQVVPGSHKRGLQPFSPKDYGTCNLGMDIEVNPDEVEYLPLKAGSLVLFSALLWHSSSGNTTADRRRAFIVSYQEATVPAGNGAQWKILKPA
jgi:phytanoyl-CoA hydroxylase